jgi:diguanylate cyclase
MRQFLRSTIGIALLISLGMWLIASSDFVGHMYWNVVYKNSVTRAPASIVLVSLDDKPTIGTADEAKLLDAVRLTMPRNVFFDLDINPGSDPRGDADLARAVASYDNDLTFVVRASKLDAFTQDAFKLPPEQIRGDAPVTLSAWSSNFLYVIERAPYSVTIGDKTYPTLSAVLAGAKPVWQSQYFPDFSVDPESVRRVAGRDLLNGSVPPSELAGRTVIITSLSQAPTGRYFGRDTVPLVMHDIAGAVALAKPININLGFLPLLLIAVVAVAFGSRIRQRRLKVPVYATMVAIVLLAPAPLRQQGLILSPDIAILMLSSYGLLRLWQLRTRRIQQTSVSGLPNLLALTAGKLEVGRDVVVAVIARYEEILATLPQDLHGECARQIERRLSIGSGAGEIFHSDGGHFAWTEEARPLENQLSHLQGLRSLFSAPLQVGPHTFDTNIHFGLDRNEGLDALTRVNSALASANEAMGNGRAIELFESHRLAEAPWELSLHARIEEGLRNGDIWLAFQSQLDLRQSKVIGAEALIRWNHPTRGPIAPDAFILQAERAGRIDSLTYWVLEQAITAALELNAIGPRFQMSINLSAQMVDKADLVDNFAEIVRRRGIDPSLLTIEITETSSVRNRPAACHNLSQLRALGFRLSIDDFGTGEASLTYLADLPSDELKLDRRFISRLLSSDRDRAIISNTILLAHALDQTVVAEGIEDGETLARLRALGCDFAQGFFIGRPQPFAVYRAEYEAGLSRQIGVV